MLEDATEENLAAILALIQLMMCEFLLVKELGAGFANGLFDEFSHGTVRSLLVIIHTFPCTDASRIILVNPGGRDH